MPSTTKLSSKGAESKDKGVEGCRPPTLDEFFALEDKEAMEIPVNEEKERFFTATNRIRRICHEKAQSKDQLSSTDVKTQVTLSVMALRRMNRLGHFRNKKIRDQVSDERKKVEEKYLKLQNLIHEIQHVQKEVTRCLEFKSAHEQIDLVPVDEFYAKASKEISKPEVTKGSSHELRLARLAWELEERKSLHNDLEARRKEKDTFIGDSDKIRGQLDTLRPKLDTLLKTSRPLQDLMDMKYEEEELQRCTAKYLPKPLFYLYLQTRAYREILDKSIELTIQGDIEAAKRVDLTRQDTPEVDSGNEEEEVKGKRRKRRATVTETLDRHKNHLLQLHPLSLEMKVPTSGEKSHVMIQFYYCTQLDVVTVKGKLVPLPTTTAASGGVLSDETFLQLLQSGDDGLLCPNPTGQKMLEHFSIDLPSEVGRIGHPFHWAQTVSGLQFPPSHRDGTDWDDSDGEDDPDPTSEDQVEGCNFLQKLIVKIRNRITSRISLQNQLFNLEQLRLNAVLKDFPQITSSKMIAKLTSWKPLTLEDYRAHPATQALVNTDPVGSDGWHFSMNIERGDAKLQALVRVGVSYPKDPPLFLLLLKWRGMTRSSRDWENLRGLEETVNLHSPSSTHSHPHLILTEQILTLRSRLDILLEIESARIKSDEFSREHLYLRQSRGPSRDLPFKYIPGSNSFVHL